MIYTASYHWLRAGAAATLLLSGGVLIGAHFAPDRSPLPPRASARVRTEPATARPLVSPAPQASPGDSSGPRMPSAPSFEALGAPPAFAGQYAVLRGASTAGAGRPAAAPVPAAVEATPEGPGDVPLAGTGGPVEPAPGEPAPDPQPNRPAPAQGIPRGIAMLQPLLSVVRPGGRAVFHDLAMGRVPTPSGLQGEWTVIGRCDWKVRVDLGMPQQHPGGLRAVGRVTAGNWSGEPVVPSQACEGAGQRYTRPRAPTDAERAAFGDAGRTQGFTAADLHQVAAVRGAMVLTFRASSGSAVVFAARGAGGVSVSATYTGGPGDGEVTLLGVYQTGGGFQAWVVRGRPASPDAVIILESSDPMRRWTAHGPYNLSRS